MPVTLCWAVHPENGRDCTPVPFLELRAPDVCPVQEKRKRYKTQGSHKRSAGRINPLCHVEFESVHLQGEGIDSGGQPVFVQTPRGAVGRFQEGTKVKISGLLVLYSAEFPATEFT